MSITTNFHTHTTYCDGKNTPEEIVRQAIDEGMTRLGFSGHAYTPFDTSYAMNPQTAMRYARDVRGLANKYKDQLQILCGLELDYFSKQDMTAFDYAVGSVHYVFKKLDTVASEQLTATAPEVVKFADGGCYVPVDETADVLSWAAHTLYDGDIYGLIEDFFREEADVVRTTHCQIIGHFDLITKFQESTPLFDEHHPRYVAAWRGALKSLLPLAVPFEINTGAISRGYRTTPYPSFEILKAIHDGGGRIVFSSDAHDKSTLRYWFPQAEELAKQAGFRTYVILGKTGTEEIGL